MSKQAFRYRNVVVGYRSNVNPELREHICEAARYDGDAHRAETPEERTAAYEQKNYHLAQAFSLDERMFILKFEGGYVSFFSKVGYPTFSRGVRRTVMHIPTRQLGQCPWWRKHRGKVCHLAGTNAGKPVSIRKSRQLWPEDFPKRKRTAKPRLTPHQHRRHSLPSPVPT